MEKVDITDLFKQSVAKIEFGEFSLADGYKLKDIISAIEIGHPKMDSGIDPIRFPLLPLSLSTNEKVWLSLELLRLEATWLDGTMISNTIFTCGFMHRPLHIPMDDMQLYCLSLLHSCGNMIRSVERGQVAMEEDFFCDHHPFNFDYDVSEQHVIDSLVNEISNLEKLHDESQNALLLLLKFRLAMQKSMLLLEENFKESETVLNKALELLYQLKAIPQLQVSASVAENLISTEFARKATSHLPKRNVITKTLQEAFSFYEKLLKDLVFVCQIAGNVSACSIADVMSSLDYFSRSKPAIFVRSKLHILLKEAYGQQFFTLVFQHFQQLVGYPFTPDAQATEFYTKMEQLYLLCFQVKCFNLSRQHRLTKRIVEEIESLCDEAAALDKVMHKFPYFSLWLRYLKLSYYEFYFAVGTELELYEMEELDMFYARMACLGVTFSHLYKDMMDSRSKHKHSRQEAPFLQWEHTTSHVKMSLHRVFGVVNMIVEKRIKPHDEERTLFHRYVKPFQHISGIERLGWNELKEYKTFLKEEDGLQKALAIYKAIKSLLDKEAKPSVEDTNPLSKYLTGKRLEEIDQLKRVAVANSLFCLRSKENPFISFKYHPNCAVFESTATQ